MDLQDHKDNRDHRDQGVLMVRLELQALQGSQGHRAPQERWEVSESPAYQALEAPPEIQGLVDQRDLKDK